jgi:acetyl esterase/lipase
MAGDPDTWRLPPLRAGHPASEDLLERRVKAGGNASAPDHERVIGGVRCIATSAAQPQRRILYFHGGGYRMGSPVAWLPYATRLAEAADAEVILPFYRLAPEHPFPASLHDAVAVYRALTDDGPLVVAGDSAGGGLAAALSIVASQAGAPPAGAVLVSPMLDFAASHDTYDSRHARDRLFSREAVQDCAALYLQGHPLNDPLVSPLHADPQDIPPALVLIGGEEVLLGEALAFTGKLALADRRVTLHAAPGMGHVWPMMAPDTPEAAEAVAAIATFVKSCLP